MKAGAFRARTWPVFLVGIGSLLALLFLPGVVALRKTSSVYREIRRIQDSQRENGPLLAGIERRVYLLSIAVRDTLLDASETTTGAYRAQYQQRRREIEDRLATLKRQLANDARVSLPKLEKEIEGYFDAIEPVFDWPPEQRAARAMYFLREQQRPRRQSIIAIAEEIAKLTEQSHSRQLDQVNQSQLKFGQDIERVILAAFVIGLVIAGVTIIRLVTLEDRAERHQKKTEKAEEELRNLSTKLMQAQEEERKTISRELHDEVGQTLTGLRMGLGGLERVREAKPEFDKQIAETKALAEQALRAVRELAVGLRPSVLDLGLAPAVQWQTRQFSRYSGIRATVTYEGRLENVPEEHRICVYRVVQECLTNAGKHSRARLVRVELKEAERLLQVSVADDGTGFDRKITGGGLGLVGMEERVRELGGVLSVRSQPGSGTTIEVRLTLPPEEAKNA